MQLKQSLLAKVNATTDLTSLMSDPKIVAAQTNARRASIEFDANCKTAWNELCRKIFVPGYPRRRVMNANGKLTEWNGGPYLVFRDFLSGAFSFDYRGFEFDIVENSFFLSFERHEIDEEPLPIVIVMPLDLIENPTNEKIEEYFQTQERMIQVYEDGQCQKAKDKRIEDAIWRLNDAKREAKQLGINLD